MYFFYLRYSINIERVGEARPSYHRCGKTIGKEFIVPDCSSTWCIRADFPEPLRHRFFPAAESQTQKETFRFFLYVSFICILQPSPRYLNGKGTRERARGGSHRKGVGSAHGGDGNTAASLLFAIAVLPEFQ